jgi:tetratricopeptide (TPR) repeat protein
MRTGYSEQRTKMPKLLIMAVLFSVASFGQQTDLARARNLYQRTKYEQALEVLKNSSEKGAPALLLMGKCQYMLGDFKKASEALEQAVQADPGNSEAHLWLGRAYGRRAETSTFFTAPGLASKARASFERSVELNPADKEAVGDLFEYYLEAPGFLGGGMDKARALAEKTMDADPAEYHYRLALIADRRKQYKDAEEQLRRSVELAPRQVGRLIELAKFLAKTGQYAQSDETFLQAERIAPDNIHLMFERAKTYIRTGRRLQDARLLLQRYLGSPLSPDDPPRSEAEELLKQAGSL